MSDDNVAPDLDEFEKTILISMCDAVNYSKKGHVPIEAVQTRVAVHLRGDAEDVLKKTLRKKGYVQKHATGNTNYELTDKGFKTCQIIKKDRLKSF